MIKKSLFILLLISTQASSQNINLVDLVNLKGQNMANAEEFLSFHDWNFIGSEEEIATFSFNTDISGQEAESFIRLYVRDSEVRWIGIQIHKKNKYNEYVEDLKSYHCKLIESKFDEDGSIVKFYKDSSKTFKITIKKEFYNILIVPNESVEFIK